MIGGTKAGEYWRTIDMLEQKTGRTTKEVMEILYFLHDSQYSNEDLGKMAKMIEENLKMRKLI